MTVYNYTTLNLSTSGSTSANGINNLGQVAGSLAHTTVSPISLTFFGFLYYPNDGYITLSDPLALTGAIGTGTWAQGVNDKGQVVGYYQGLDNFTNPTAGTFGFLYNNGTYTTLSGPAFGINDAGQVVGTFGLYNLSDGTYTTLGGRSAHGINNLGQIVGSELSYGFLYNPNDGTYTTLKDPLGISTEALGINDLGQIVGTYTDSANVQHGFLYSAGAYITLDRVVSGINNSGVLVGRNFFAVPGPNPPPPANTSADMILRGANASSVPGLYQIYDIGNNAMLASYSLAQVGTDFAFVTLGGFNDGDTSDMLLRNSNSGGFQVYNIINNQISGSAFLGNVGLNWQVTAFGNFSSLGENDMILRNTGTGGMQVYDISNNQITGSAFMGTVGLNWQMAGISNHGTQSDLVLRDSGSGGLEIYNIANNAITGAAFLGSVGLDWQPSGFGDFSSRNEGDMLLRNVNTGGLELYDIANNAITGAFFLGNVGLDWQYAGIGPIQGPGTSDLVLRNVNTGAFQVYNIAGNTLVGSASLGAVGLEWQLGGFAADPPTGAMGSSDNSTPQLVQAMAGFDGGSGAADGLNAGVVNADMSHQPFLTTSQHG
jgi:probable HAF family extracellular repeat protein